MKLDTLAQRHKLINDLVKKGFEFEESLIHAENSGDDWGGAMSTVENLVTIEEMIRTEEIFLVTYGEMDNVRTRNFDEKEIYLSMVDDALIYFVDTILLRRIEFAFDHLNGWNFVSDGGKKFQKTFCKKLDALRKKYQDIYDL